MPAEPTRVLHVIKGLGPGGAERLLVNVATAGDPTAVRHRVAYVVPEKSHLVEELRRAGITVDCLGSHGGAAWLRRLRRVMVSDRPHIVHAHSPHTAVGARLVARSLLRGRRPLTVSTEHNRWPAYHRVTRLANALTYSLDARHLAVSDDARLSVWAPLRGSTEVLDHGIDVASMAERRRRREAVRADLGAGATDVVAVTVANYRTEKDYPTLLAAARMVLDAGAGVRFFVVGQGPLASDVEQLHAQMALGEGVVLLGYRPDAADVIAAADLFVLSSRHEGLPVAVMEALAAGVPIVATAVGGLPHAVTHGGEGLLVQPGRPADLAAAVVELASDEAVRTAMGKAAARRAWDFDIGPAARRLEDFYAAVRS